MEWYCWIVVALAVLNAGSGYYNRDQDREDSEYNEYCEEIFDTD